jgi:Zn-dependent protease
LQHRSFGIPDLAVSWVALSVAGYLLYNSPLYALGGPLRIAAWENFIVIFLVLGPAFVLHEAMHIRTARKLGKPAGFKLWPFGIFIMLITSIIGFLFALPGATMIETDRRNQPALSEMGVIAIAGPLTNIILSLISGTVTGIGILIGNIFVVEAGLYSIGINAFLAGFNLLPVAILDGAKVYKWNKRLWAMFFFPSIVIGMFIMFTLF